MQNARQYQAYEKLLVSSLKEVSLFILKPANRFVYHGNFFQNFNFCCKKHKNVFVQIKKYMISVNIFIF